MPKFRKKPVVIEAFLFCPAFSETMLHHYADRAPTWFLEAECDGKACIWNDDEEPYCMIETLEGRMRTNPGDWIIRGVKGELYPATYEPAE